jgi:diacylglycerol kinase (ATP)
MRTTLIHNPSAGGSTLASSADLEAALCAIGLEATHRPTASEADLERALDDPGDLVVVAGGDGTVRVVASHLAGHGVPLTVLPMGTANNIGAALGLTGSPLELIAALEQPRRRWLDLGRVRGPWGERVFLEGAGVGLFASVMAAYGPDDGKSPFRALTAGLQTINGYVAPECHLVVDGVPRSDRCLLVEAMNTASIGPRLRLAPDADPSDGWLEVVTISEDGRVGLTAYLTGLLAGRLETLPNVTVTKARLIRLEWSGSALHVDAEVLGDENDGPQWAEILLERGGLELWLPEEHTLVEPEAVGAGA